MTSMMSVSAILEDIHKSSTELFNELLEVIKNLVQNLETLENFEAVLESLIDILNHKRKEMAIFSNVANKINDFRKINSEINFEKQKTDFLILLENLININTITIENAVKYLKKQNHISNIITLSYSKLVKETIEFWKPNKVFICESRPLVEGTRLAQELSLSTPNTHIVINTDASGPKIVLEKADAVVLGMDAWFPDNSISNKTGSLSLAMAAKSVNKPVYVIGNFLKKVSITVEQYRQENHTKDFEDIYPSLSKKITFENDYFEIVPANMLTKILE